MKPILFNTEMVRAILDGRKTCTRRVIKPQPKMQLAYVMAGNGCVVGKWTYPPPRCIEESGWEEKYRIVDGLTQEDTNQKWTPPCHSNDILYVRETWKQATSCPSGSGYDVRDWYLYKVDEPQDTTGMMVERKWHPSIHMPKEAARLFLRVTGVRAEKLHEIRERGPRSAEEEGFVNDIDLINGCGKSATRHFAELWDKTIKPTDRPVYGWEACPWVWVIEFERISEKEAEA